MRSWLATALTMVVLLAATGGAIALGEGGSSASEQGGASTAQYKPGKGCGKPGQHVRGGQCKPKKHGNGKKPKKGHKPSTKSHPRSSNCKFRVIGQTLIAYCPLS